MRYVILLILAMSTVSALSQKNDQIVLVTEHMNAQEKAWNNADIAGFMKYYWKSDSLKFIGSKGITYGWQKTYDNYLKGYPTKEAMGILTFTIKEVTQLSETCIYVIGQWELKKEKPAGGYFTLLWKKINGQWVIVADHTS
ncbi:MAG: nuclear transport factor 2 family protein [Bacteroidota bacterium]